MVAEISELIGAGASRSEADDAFGDKPEKPLRWPRAGHEHETASLEGRDEVTGLDNPLGFLRRFQQITEVENSAVAIVSIHLHSYGVVLHCHGLTIARMLIAHVASILTKELDTADNLAHFGDGEFMLLLRPDDERNMDESLAHLEQTILCQPFHLPAGRGEMRVRISARICAVREGTNGGGCVTDIAASSPGGSRAPDRVEWKNRA